MSTSQPPVASRSSRSAGDLLRTLAVVAVLVVAIIVVNYRAPEDPVREVDARAVAVQVAPAAQFDVLVPTDPGWRATSARWEPTPESQLQPVWFTGGVYSADGPFASVAQAAVVLPDFVAEQTGEGRANGSAVVAGRTWQRYESPGARSLVLIDGSTTVVSGTLEWPELERFVSRLEPVAP